MLRTIHIASSELQIPIKCYSELVNLRSDCMIFQMVYADIIVPRNEKSENEVAINLIVMHANTQLQAVWFH